MAVGAAMPDPTPHSDLASEIAEPRNPQTPMTYEPARSSAPRRRRSSEVITVALAALAVVVLVAMVVVDRFSGPSRSAATVEAQAPTAGIGGPGEGAGAAVPPTTVVPSADEPKELDGSQTAGGKCLMEVASLKVGSSGASVVCLQQALAAAGLYSGAAGGSFDTPTYAAVRRLQEQRNLFVDGAVGRETAISLGIWPEESSLVVRTPAPPAGTVDAMGYRLSSVASTGSSAPPVPPTSGSGKRIVYDRAGQRVWAIDKNEGIIRSWLVSGSKFSNEVPGTHKVYSRSPVSTAWNGKAYLPKMVRYYQTDIGHIGFHAIPLHVEDRSVYQTEAELGTRLSGGCQRQANLDAAFLWDFAQIGTKVVVV